MDVAGDPLESDLILYLCGYCFRFGHDLAPRTPSESHFQARIREKTGAFERSLPFSPRNRDQGLIAPAAIQSLRVIFICPDDAPLPATGDDDGEPRELLPVRIPRRTSGLFGTQLREKQMRDALTKLFARFRKDEEGVTLVEYGIALILAVTVGVTVLGGLASDVNLQMDAACDQMTGGGNITGDTGACN
ncbi:MAG: Flp family type IVb pilin [Paracoccaceae bacterium]